MFFHLKPDIVVVARFKNFWYSFYFEFADHSNGLALLYFTRFRKASMFLVRSISICFIIKIIASILRCDVWYGTNLTTRKITPYNSSKTTLDMMVAEQRATFIWKIVSMLVGFEFFLSSPLFLPVGHCFRGWSKRNLKVYDVINCLNENLIAYFVWYYEKKKRYDI